MKLAGKRLLAALCAALLLCALAAGCTTVKDGMKPGTYVGTGSGHGGELQATVVIGPYGNIQKITITQQAESPEYATDALAALPRTITEAQRLDVDAVSGATITSNAVKAAVADAITQAGGDPAAWGYVPPDESAQGVSLTITGLPEGELTITGAQLMEDYEPVHVTAVSVDSKGEETTVEATGVLLETILAEHGASQKDYGSIITSATDGYAIEIPDGILQTRDILIAYEVNGEPQHPRIVIPDERAMYWAKFLATIELMDPSEVAAAEVGEVVLLEPAIGTLAGVAEDYKYYDETQKALPTAALLGAYAPQRAAFVTLRSLDKLNKNEKYDTFAEQYIMYTGGEDVVPLYTGPTLPEGMQVKQLLSAQVGEVTLLSVDMLLASMEQDDTVGVDRDALPLSVLLETAGVKEADSYTLVAADGAQVTLAAADLPAAYLALRGTQDQPAVSCYLDGATFQEGGIELVGLLRIRTQ